MEVTPQDGFWAILAGFIFEKTWNKYTNFVAD
jgi:hypothetical protein